MSEISVSGLQNVRHFVASKVAYLGPLLFPSHVIQHQVDDDLDDDDEVEVEGEGEDNNDGDISTHEYKEYAVGVESSLYHTSATPQKSYLALYYISDPEHPPRHFLQHVQQGREHPGHRALRFPLDAPIRLRKLRKLLRKQWDLSVFTTLILERPHDTIQTADVLGSAAGGCYQPVAAVCERSDAGVGRVTGTRDGFSIRMGTDKGTVQSA